MKYLGIEGLKYLCNKISTALKNAEIKIQNHSSTSASTSVSGHVKFGTTSGTACQGNDSRLSDARTPKSHTHDDRYYTESEVDSKFANISTDETLSEAGKPADAGAVGIKLNEVKDSIRSVEASLGSHDHDSQYIKLSGGTFDSGTSFTFVNGNGDTVIDVNNPDTNDYVHIQAEGISATGHLIGNVSYSSVTFDSNDTYKNPTAWQEVDLLGSHQMSVLLKNISTMMANVRWMKNQMANIGSSNVVFKPVKAIASSTSVSYTGDSFKPPTNTSLQLLTEIFNTPIVEVKYDTYLAGSGQYLLKKAGYYRITVFNRYLNYIWRSEIRAIDFYGTSYNDFAVNDEDVNNMSQHVIYADADAVARKCTDISIIIRINPETINQYDTCAVSDWHIGFEYLGQ